MQIKDTIKKLRTDYKYTQVDLADMLNCNRQKIADWERGKSTPSTDDLILLARIFDTTTDYLLGISYVKTVNPEINSINYALGLSSLASCESASESCGSRCSMVRPLAESCSEQLYG